MVGLSRVILCLLQFNFKESNIRLKALAQLLCFNPVVDYPKK